MSVIPAAREAEAGESLEPRDRGCSELRLCHGTPVWVTRARKKKRNFSVIAGPGSSLQGSDVLTSTQRGVGLKAGSPWLLAPDISEGLILSPRLECIIMAHCSLDLLGSNWVISLVETGFCHVGLAALKLLTSGDPTAASQSAGIASVSHFDQPANILNNGYSTCICSLSV
ncbi:hypothetical protein AAY473_034152, partial [Plecturocebus cupreus]